MCDHYLNRLWRLDTLTRVFIVIKLAQINEQNSRLATDEVRKILVDKGIDATALQEIYNWKGEIRGLGISTKIITDTKTFVNRIDCNNVKSAIAIPNLKMKTLKLEHLCNSHFSCVEIGTPSTSFYLVGVYMQFSEPINHFLQHLGKIMDSLRGKK